MAAFVTKEVDMTEHHVTCYPTRKALWQYVKNEGLEELLQFLLSMFCQLLYTKNAAQVASATLVSLLLGNSEL